MMAIQIRAYFLGLLFSLLSFSSIFAQQSEAPADTAFKKVMEESFKELEESDYAENVQRKYAEIFWDYYLEHPERKYSEWVGVHAFKFWGNIGAATEVDNAMAKLDYDVPIWSHIVAYIYNSYNNSDEEPRKRPSIF